jgi:hypothetical protein
MAKTTRVRRAFSVSGELLTKSREAGMAELF